MAALISIFTLALVASDVVRVVSGQPFCSDPGSHEDADLTVKIQGSTVHGTTNSTTPDVRKFLGIPYAFPPAGQLRFTKSQPARPFGEMDAKTPGPNCTQYLGSNPSKSPSLQPERTTSAM
jgi:hypothetical protein